MAITTKRTPDAAERPLQAHLGEQIGPATLYCGDAFDVLRRLPDATVQAVITDPPYSSGGQFRSDRIGTTNQKYVNTENAGRRLDFTGDNRDQRSYLLWAELWMRECLRVATPGALIAVFTDWRQLPVTTDALQVAGWVWRGIVVWDKTEAARPAKGRYRAQCEYVAWGSKGPLPAPAPDAACHPGVFRQAVRQADKHHIAGKPVEVMRGLVRAVPRGGVILDPFAGSGSTLVAATLEGYSSIGIEMMPEYAAIARERLLAATAERKAPAD